MEDPSSKPHQSWLQRLKHRITKDGPSTEEELRKILRAASQKKLISEGTLSMLEGVLNFSHKDVRDVMVRRSKTDVIKMNEPLENILDIVEETTHSRFPVVGEDKDDVLGVLHVKHLLQFFSHPERFSLKEIIHSPVFVPESKSSFTLLRECQASRNHMVMVVDEYGGTSGIITIEDLIEEIIGEIEDEFDLDANAESGAKFALGQNQAKAETVDQKPSNSWFHRLKSHMSSDEPETIEDLCNILREANQQKVISDGTFSMLEGVLNFSHKDVRDLMVSRSQMHAIRINESLDKIIDIVTETTHSRFPVIGEDKDDVLGILHVKYLLPFFAHPETFNLKDIIQPPVFVPESKSSFMLLRECQASRNHMVMVVDEYGGTSGLITIEDLIEEVTGEIEDEFDLDDTAANIVELSPGRYQVKAMTEVDDINEFFHTQFSDEEVDSIGGLVIQELGRLPEKGEKLVLDKLNLTIARVDPRRLHTLIVVCDDKNI